MVKARKWVLVKQFSGFPKDSDLELQEEELPELNDGGEHSRIWLKLVSLFIKIAKL